MIQNKYCYHFLVLLSVKIVHHQQLNLTPSSDKAAFENSLEKEQNVTNF